MALPIASKRKHTLTTTANYLYEEDAIFTMSTNATANAMTATASIPYKLHAVKTVIMTALG